MLLVSDFDFLLTIVSVTSYFFAAGIFYLFLGLIGAFFMIIGGCILAARESGKFIDRFKEKVDGNEIQGIGTEDLNAALKGARIWEGDDLRGLEEAGGVPQAAPPRQRQPRRRR